MRTLIVTEFQSLDGVIDSPGGGEDYPHAGWTFKDVAPDEQAYELKGREQGEAAAMLVGRVTYQEFAPVWPDLDFFPQYNEMPKYVVSTTLSQQTVNESRWQPVTVLRGLDEVRALKDGDGGPIIVHGSATLAQGLFDADLVDRYHLLTFPVVLGSGRRLFGGDAPKRTLTLVESQVYQNGIVMGVYDVQR